MSTRPTASDSSSSHSSETNSKDQSEPATEASAAGVPATGSPAADILDAVYATAPVGLGVLDADLRYVRVNERLAQMNGLAAEQHVGKTVRAVNPRWADQTEPTLRRVLETGSPALKVTNGLDDEAGGEYTRQDRWTPLRNAQGKVVGINVVAETVPERTGLIASESPEHYRRLLSYLGDGFGVCELLVDEQEAPYDFRFLEVNLAFTDHTGLEDATGKSISALVPDLEPDFLREYSQVVSERQPVRFEQYSAVMDRWFAVYAFPFGPPGSRRFAIQFKDISDRKRKEKALQQAREDAEWQQRQLEDLFEKAPVAISIYLGPRYVVKMMNATACRLSGRTQEEAVGTPLFDLLPELTSLIQEPLRGVMTTGEPYVAREFPTPIHRYGRQETAYWDFIYYPVRNDRREVVGVTVVGTEVTELVKDRKEAERQQRKLANLLERFPVGVATFRGPSHTVEIINSKAAEMWSIDRKSLLKQPLFTALPELKDQQLADLADEVFRTGEPFVANEFPVVFNWKNKSETAYIDFVYQPWQDEHDEIIGVIAVGTDVSERVEARREEYKLRALLENSLGLVGLTDPEGQMVYLNPAGRDMLGIDPPSSTADHHLLDFFTEEDWDYAQDTILPTLRNQEKGEWIGEYRFRHAVTHQAIVVLCNCFAVRDPVTDELLGLGIFATDITERQRQEAELGRYREELALSNQELAAINEEMNATNEELEAANFELNNTNGRLTRVNSDLDNFVYTASHDLKAPISNIKGLLTLLEQNLSPDSLAAPITQKALKMMGSSVERFMRTIADLSDIGRLQRLTDEPEELIELSAAIEAVRLDIVPMIEETEARLDIEVDACGPVRFSPRNLRSVVYNLLSNAVKYRDPRRKPHVRVRCETTEDYYVLTVADNGLGMDLSEDRQLFGLFQRLHTHVEGTGIGLYIVRKIIENAGGKIEVVSTVGVGTTFTVYFKR